MANQSLPHTLDDYKIFGLYSKCWWLSFIYISNECQSQTQGIVKNQKSSKTKSKTNIETTDSECDENFGSDSYDSFDEINQSMKSLVSEFTDVET